MVRLHHALIIPLLGLSLGACASFEPGRSTGRQIDDFNASLAVKSAMLRAEGYRLGQVDVEITEGVMLLSGSAPRDTDRRYAECLAWSASGVRSVVNEIEVGEWRSSREFAEDQRITQQVRARLVQDREIRSIHFNVEAREAVVYLLGYARSADEARRAAAHAAQVAGVARVVDLTRVGGETLDLPARGAFQADACDAAGDVPLQPGAPGIAPPPSTLDAPPLDGAPAEPEASQEAAPAAPRRFEPQIERTEASESARESSPEAMPF